MSKSFFKIGQVYQHSHPYDLDDSCGMFCLSTNKWLLESNICKKYNDRVMNNYYVYLYHSEKLDVKYNQYINDYEIENVGIFYSIQTCKKFLIFYNELCQSNYWNLKNLQTKNIIK